MQVALYLIAVGSIVNAIRIIHDYTIFISDKIKKRKKRQREENGKTKKDPPIPKRRVGSNKSSTRKRKK